MAAMALLAALAVFAGPVTRYLQGATDELFDYTAYVTAVLYVDNEGKDLSKGHGDDHGDSYGEDHGEEGYGDDGHGEADSPEADELPAHRANDAEAHGAEAEHVED